MPAGPLWHPWRRFLRFSVRVLIVLVLLIGVALGWLVRTVRSARTQHEAVAAIEDAGGFVQYNGEAPVAWDVANWKRVDGTPNFPTWAPSSLVGFVGADLLAHVTDVSLCATKRSAAIEGIAHLTHLRALRLTGPAVSDHDLRHLNRLTNLETLDLGNTRVTDAGLLHLKGTTTLFRVDLVNTQITDCGLRHLKGLTNLRWLDVKGTQVTDAAVEELTQALPNLTIFH